MNAKLCATITGRDTEELRAHRDAAFGAEMVELRLDYAQEIDIAGVLADRRVPVIVTCRPTWGGGRFSGSEEERRTLLTRALELGAEFVDVEWSGRPADLDPFIEDYGGGRLVLSVHDFEGMPADLVTQYRAMRSTGAAVVKVAVRVTCLSDLVRLRDVAADDGDSTGRDSTERKVIIGMGPAGLPSRLIPDRFGSCWTYAGDSVAPGQVGLARMRDEYRVGRVSAAAELFGIVGAPLEHSLSPAMHNAGFQATNRDAVYLPLEATDVDDLFRFAAAFDLRGASVTAPFKSDVMTRVTTTDDLSRRVGAINTLRATPDGWEGINTDVPGFLAPLQGHLQSGARAAVLGAGGAARGVAVALADEGATVTIHARKPERAQTVASLVDGATGPVPPPVGSWDILVNTTPVGTFPRTTDSPLRVTDFGAGIVYDLVYNPRVTRLMQDAADAGCRTIGGLDMLVAQAERQFAWWTGAPPPEGVFLRAAEQALHRQESASEELSRSRRGEETPPTGGTRPNETGLTSEP